MPQNNRFITAIVDAYRRHSARRARRKLADRSPGLDPDVAAIIMRYKASQMPPDLRTTANSPSAVSRVFRTWELLEAILLAVVEYGAHRDTGYAQAFAKRENIP
jgi:hypothetical protein